MIKHCEQCGSSFDGRKEKRFCSVSCRNASFRIDPDERRKRLLERKRARSKVERQDERRKAKGSSYKTRNEYLDEFVRARLDKAYRAIDRQASKNARQAFDWWLSQQPASIVAIFDEHRRRRDAERVRKSYRSNPIHFRMKVKAKKHANPEYVARYSKRRGERMIATSDGSITARAVERLLRNSEFCLYCWRLTPLERRSVEHVIPLARGGTHTMTNLAMACIECNLGKGAKLPIEYLMDQHEVCDFGIPREFERIRIPKRFPRVM